MKKTVGIFLILLTTGGLFTLNAYTRCYEVPATRNNAGRILDWCDDVTCKHCIQINNGYEADLEWVEFEAECL